MQKLRGASTRNAAEIFTKNRTVESGLAADNELRMSPIGTEDFWEDLLDFIEQRKVIPVIGEHAVTFGEGNQPLYPWLAGELANELGVTGARLAAGSALNDVARERRLLAGGERNAIYTRLYRILRERCPVPGGTLRDLAGIAAFNLYLTTTFDPLLVLEGRAEDILGQFYERCFSSQPSAVRTFVENRLLSATGFRESTTLDTATHELTRAGLTHDGALEAIAGLVDARLLTSEERGGIRRIELTHDILTSIARCSRTAARNASKKSWLIAGPRRKGKPKRMPKRALAKPASAPPL